MTNNVTEIEVEALPIEVDSLPIELYKALKIANVVSGGGEAKHAISEGYVAVNGELEQRKRRKLEDGDVIEFNGEFFFIDFQPQVDFTPDFVPPPKEALSVSSPSKASGDKGKKSHDKAKKANGKKAAKKADKGGEGKRVNRDSNTGRRSISF
uniref:RNA-binding S4 domain-containing protein n=1 Tax=Thaumasiovibrio occultus TaxID=1891184 RepID=UPI000B3573BE|nr:RNA-binding S4 domain-containing protein [Thaumasiovibrio occultus]